MTGARTFGAAAQRRFGIGLLTLVVLAAGGGWLGLTYLGVLSRDVRVTADLVAFGDALGPGAKVRYDGLIVGRVQSLDDSGDGPRATLLLDPDQADAIPEGSTARVLPSTAFGSEYVELVPPAATSGRPVADGSHLAADTSEETLALMASFEQAQRLLAAVDAEALSRATGSLAAALDGRGASLGGFVERADQLVTAMNDDADLFYGTLDDASAAADVLTGLLPAATGAAENARTTAATIVDRETDLATLIGTTGELVAVTDAAVARHTPVLVDLLATTAGPLEIFADHPAELQAILAGVPGVLHNGATAIDESSIQMNGLIGLDPLDPYTALDCPTYGTLQGSNCGGPVPLSMQPGAPADPETVASITDLLRTLDGEGTAPVPTPGTTPATSAPGSTAAPGVGPAAPAAPLSPLQQLFMTLLGGGAS